nr:hypothetical protein VIGAN_01167800 [Ipomoea batatas]
MASKASDLPRVLEMLNTVTVSGTGTSSSFQESMMPKLAPPPPLIAQKRSSPHGFTVQDSPVNIHDSGVNHVRGSGLDPRRLLPNVNLDRPEFDQVQNGKGEGGNKGNALVIVAAASGPELDVILSGANECSSDVGFP